MQTGSRFAAVCLLAFLSQVPAALAKDYFVSPAGDDSNDGLSTAKPFLNIYRAADLTLPGDTVYLLGGTHQATADFQDNSQIVNIDRSGESGKWIRYTAYPGEKPAVKFRGWSGFRITASYIEISQLEFVGVSSETTLETARANSTGSNPRLNGNGITVEGRAHPNSRPHHIRIQDNLIHHCPGSGIAAIQADYLTISGNRVYSNAWYSVYAGSGISIYQPWSLDGVTSYKIRVEGNECYNNKSLIPWIATGALSDGNGIIYDDSRNLQNDSLLGVYSGHALIANNVSYLNGGSGIHAFSSAHCDLVNNTAFKNGAVLNYPDLYAQDSLDISILNNIVYTRPERPANRTLGNVDLRTDYNLYFNDASTPIKGSHDKRGDPGFYSLPEDDGSGEVTRFDFRLRPRSPAIDSASAFSSLDTDFFQAARAAGTAPDMGASESLLVDSEVATPKLINLSTRSFVGQGSALQIAGFVTRGTASKRFMVRAVGGGLAPFGLSENELLGNPSLAVNLVSSSPPLLGFVSNDDWDALNSLLVSTTASVGAFPLTSGSHDAALTATLEPGAYTVHVEGLNQTSGIALVEIYDANPAQDDCNLINLSTRAYLRSGTDSVIGGFVIRGNGWRSILIRGLGAYLANFLDPATVFKDPSLKVFQQNSGKNILIAENEDYTNNKDLLDTASDEANLAPLGSDSKDAALALTLEAGAYTVVLGGKTTDSGLALVEIYAIP